MPNRSIAPNKKTVAKDINKSIGWNNKLILYKYFLSIFGKKTLAELAGKMNDTEYEGFDENQNTFFWGELDALLRRQGDNSRLSRDKLRDYDERICRYVKHINVNRGGIKLKYFQYIACLFTEIYLDRYFSDKPAFAIELNDYMNKIYTNNSDDKIIPFAPENMNKLAFMCATGSGKTLIMHINILQFCYYQKKAAALNPRQQINKIIILAPNEEMSHQHLSELKLSNIQAVLFDKNNFVSNVDVIVIDMNKLKEDGKIKTVSIDSFEQNNLVLIDESHRGLAGDVWYDYRSRLSAEGGFAFEYSATLKQAMKSSKTSNTTQLEWKNRLDEYFRSIIIDYSYKYFYEDGYGKEYRIYNLKDSISEEQRQLYLVGCLLSFYQQLKIYIERGKTFMPFMIEKPLLVFVGNRVTANTSTAEMTDIEEVLDFLDKFVRNQDTSIRRINTIINEETGITDGSGRELFSLNYTAIISFFGSKPNPVDIYKDILRLVFNYTLVSSEPRLHMLHLKNTQGEIALRIGSNSANFGVISIGDTAGLTKKCEAKGIITKTELFSNISLFRTINEKGSDINVLIGSRKFTEGWNSWRVSTMGLINFAKGEGSQAIQLFGRGVRLRGYVGSLKRSSKLGDYNIGIPKNIELLETLSIFGIRAQYMEDFKKHLEMEDMPLNEKPHDFTLPVINRYDNVKHKELRVIRVKNGANFKKHAARLVLLPPDKGFLSYLNKNKVIIDCRAKVQTIQSASSQQLDSQNNEEVLASHVISFLDYERIYNELENYKNEKHYYNISLCKSAIADILLTDGWYALIIPKKHLILDSMQKLIVYTDFAVMALKIYIDRFYKYEKSRFESPLLEYHELNANDNNFIDEYRFSYYNSSDDDKNAETIKRFVEDLQICLNDSNSIPAYQDNEFHDTLIAFDLHAHLYTPLICIKTTGLKLSVSPTSLNPDEKRFIDLLKEWIDNNTNYLMNKDLYILRNKSKTGMSFFEAGNFYPDFVMWINTPNIQYITFIDPKGLLRVKWDDPKIMFSSTIKNLETRLQISSPNKHIILNSFIMSGTNAETLNQWWSKTNEERHTKNVFCLNDKNCIDMMMNKILKQ